MRRFIRTLYEQNYLAEQTIWRMMNGRLCDADAYTDPPELLAHTLPMT